MLIPLSEYLERTNNAPFKIKQAEYELSSAEELPAAKKAQRSIRYLQEAGLIPGFELSGRILRQTLGQGSHCFQELLAPELDAHERFFKTTSTANSLRRALKKNADEFGADSRFESLTGMCCFGGGTDIARTQTGFEYSIVELGGTKEMQLELPSGDQIVSVKVDDRFSLYEGEKISRMCSLISTLRNQQGVHISIPALRTPRIEYYLYLMPLFESGFITADAFRQWMDAVRVREARVEQAMRKRLGDELRTVPSALECVEDEIIQQTESLEPIELATVLEYLNERDGAWRETLEHQMPSTWKELINLSYVVSFIGFAKHAATRGAVAVHVDDPLEGVILSEVARLQRRLRRNGIISPPLIGMYAPQELVWEEPGKDSDLYYMKPTPEAEENVRRQYDRNPDLE